MPVTAASLERQASDLRAKSISNISMLATLDFETRSTTKTLTNSRTGTEQQTSDRVKWQRSKQRLKWTRLDSTTQAFVANGAEKTLFLLNGTTTSFDSSLTEAEAAELSRPKPAWIWQPDWFIPAKAAEVRDDGTALVLTTSKGHPRREIWLEKSTGCLLKFTDTDATGRQVRVVDVSGWHQTGGVWLPGAATETVTGATGGFVRVIEFVSAIANPEFTEASFALP